MPTYVLLVDWTEKGAQAVQQTVDRLEEGAKLGETERARWRKQAREWLRADLEVWAKVLGNGSPATRGLAKKLLTHWQVDPDLAGLREPGALEKLSADERKDCLGLWAQVAAVLARSQK